MDIMTTIRSLSNDPQDIFYNKIVPEALPSQIETYMD